jgi:rhomboid protease GluP
MKEPFINKLLNDFCQFYDYAVIEVSTLSGLASTWALVKNIDLNSKRVIVFLNEVKSFDTENMMNSLKHGLNCDNIQLTKIVLLDKAAINNMESISAEHLDEAEVIAINCEDYKILSYGYKCEETAYELANILGYNNKDSSKGKNTKGGPWATYSIIMLNVLMYIITAVLSGNIFDSDINVLVLLGAKYNDLIIAGEYYRLITCMFLHGGIVHLALNMYSLNSIGPLIERIYGKVKYLIIYFVSGIVSSVLSFLFSDGISIGASGAIFGLLGTTLVFAVTMRKNIGKDFLRSIASVIIVNLFIGFNMANIDNFGHIGGLIGGIITGIIFNIKNKK